MFPIISDQHHHTMHDCVVYNFKRSISLMPQSGSKSKHLKDHLAPRVSNVLPALFCVRYVQGDFLTAPSLSLKSLSMEKLGKVNLRWQIDERFTIPGKNLQLHWNEAGSQEIRPDSNHPTKPINLMHAPSCGSDAGPILWVLADDLPIHKKCRNEHQLPNS